MNNNLDSHQNIIELTCAGDILQSKQEVGDSVSSIINSRYSYNFSDSPFRDTLTLLLLRNKSKNQHSVNKRLSNKSKFSFSVDKENAVLSDLSVMMKGNDLFFIHDMQKNSAEVWKYVNDTHFEDFAGHIPVEPIMFEGKEKGIKKRVYSRFCGESIELLQKNHEIPPEIHSQIDKIKKSLSENKIIHFDMHLGNFVIECIDKDYLEKSLSEGKNINSLKYDSKYFTSYEKAVHEKERYSFIVRLIDWDLCGFDDNEEEIIYENGLSYNSL